MQFLYTLVIYLLLPFVLLRLLYLGINNPGYRSRWQERFGFVDSIKFNKPIIWIHAVSVGEVNAARPIIGHLLESYPQYQLLVTTVTPTGAATVKQHFNNDVIHYYFPYDLPVSVKRFIKAIKPSLFITMETEIWPNLFCQLHRSNIPVLIINARLSEKSVNGYRLISGLTKRTLSFVSDIAVQTKRDQERFILLGMSNEKVTVTGNLKFDITVPVSINEQAESLKRYFSVNRPIWIAASTHEGEEEIVLKAHKAIEQKHNSAILIIAPRHPERTHQVVSLCNSHGFKVVKRTDQIPFAGDCQVYILDTLGELQLHYAASQLAFVGGSLVNTGGQNMMEPASLGIPVICGPSTYNFVEITDLLKKRDALITVSNHDDLASQVCKLFEDANVRHTLGEKARDVIESNRGNVARLLQIVEPYLSQ